MKPLKRLRLKFDKQRRRVTEEVKEHFQEVDNARSAADSYRIGFRARRLRDCYEHLSREALAIYKALQSGDQKAINTRLRVLSKEGGIEEDSITAYQDHFEILARAYENGAGSIVGTPHQDYILNMLFSNEDTFSEKSKTHELEEIGESVQEGFREKLQSLRILYDADVERLIRRHKNLLVKVRDATTTPDENPELYVEHTRPLPPTTRFSPSGRQAPKEGNEAFQKQKQTEFKREIADLPNWDHLYEKIAAHNRSVCAFDGAERYALGTDSRGQIILLPQPMGVRRKLEDLIGYEREKGMLEGNVEQLLDGKDANHAFITGPPGTGKSSTVNALLTEHGSKGLRVVDVPAKILPLLSAVFPQFRERPDYKFILYCDEFKVGEDEKLYDNLKIMMEGAFDAIPKNARLMVCSNEEKATQLGFGESKDRNTTALEERFGLVVNFPLPNRETQRNIMQHYLERGEKETGLDEAMKQLDEHCKERVIENPSPRSIKNFAKRLS